MATIRVIKDSDNPYVMLNKTALNDENLSFKAKGIFAYLMSKPDDWKCQVTDLQNNSSDGRDAIRSGLRELREHGYLIKRPIKDGFGKITEWEEILYEIPQESAKEIFKEQTKNKTKKTSINGKSVSGEKVIKSINGFSVNGKSTSGKHVPLLSNDGINKNFNNNNSTTQQELACSEIDTSNKDLIEKETHLTLTPNQVKKVNKWDIKKIDMAIKLFNRKNGEYFALLEKIFNDSGNFAPNMAKKGKFHSYEQRTYDFEDLESRLLKY